MKSGTVSSKHHRMVSLVGLQSELLRRLQTVLLQFLHLSNNQSTSLANTTVASLVESMQLALIEIKNLPPFLRYICTFYEMILAWSG